MGPKTAPKSGSRNLPRMVNPTKADEEAHFNDGTWLSLLGLLDIFEIFVTVDQTTLWQRHIAWANKGKDIREYNTKRFGANMIFLSLLLGSTMAILTNGADFSTQMRTALSRGAHWTVKYWMGITLIVGAVVNLMGLVSTYTAWGLLISISDNNSHALLRSSMGQYICSLPSRFVVGALYLYLLTLILFLMEVVYGPGRIILISFIMVLFFQVVTSMSAFGRLIIHTGAMGEKRVLDPEFERQLLPTGLHASLLIKAMERKRLQTAVTAQYQSRNSPGKRRRKVITPNHSQRSELVVQYESVPGQLSAMQSKSPDQRVSDYGSTMTPSETESKRSRQRINTDENETILRTARARAGEKVSFAEPHRDSSISLYSADDLEIEFPRASILNRIGSKTCLFDILQKTQSNSDDSPEKHETSMDLQTASEKHLAYFDRPAALESRAENEENNSNNKESLEQCAKRLSVAAYQRGSHSRPNIMAILREWQAEEDVRVMYGFEPPVDFLDELDDEKKYEYGKISSPMPRSSIQDKLRCGSMVRYDDRDYHDDDDYDGESGQLLDVIEEVKDGRTSNASGRSAEAKV